MDSFSMEDVARIEIERALWGYVDSCTVTYYVGTGDSAVHEAETDCR